MNRRSVLSGSVCAICLPIQFLLLLIVQLGFYSLFSITEEPFVKSGGIASFCNYRFKDMHLSTYRSMDGFLLERQKGPSTCQVSTLRDIFQIPSTQLFARRGKLDDNHLSSWTSFEMVLREPSPIPPPFDLTRFLTSSITFMTHLQEISVYFNDWCLLKLKKAVGLPQLHQIPRGLSLTSPNKYMSVTSLREIRKLTDWLI
jgi:hypothetical protein